jgi:hypothetical protein
VNPGHLFAGTALDNNQDARSKGRSDSTTARAALARKFSDPQWVEAKYAKTLATKARNGTL